MRIRTEVVGVVVLDHAWSRVLCRDGSQLIVLTVHAQKLTLFQMLDIEVTTMHLPSSSPDLPSPLPPRD